MAHNFKAGETVYSEDGQEAEYVAGIPEGHIVRPLVEAYDGDEEYMHLCDPVTWRAAFVKPPVAKYNDELKAVHGELATARKSLSDLRSESATAQRDSAALLARLKKLEPLRYIEDFLDNKVTHYAHLDNYGRAEIIPIEKAMCSSDRYTPRLLALYGDTKTRGISWRLHQYSDSSGSFPAGQWMPARSEEEARECVRTFIAQFLARGDAHQQSYFTSFVRAANHWGVPVPEKFQIQADKEAEETRKRLIENAATEFERAKQRYEAAVEANKEQA